MQDFLRQIQCENRFFNISVFENYSYRVRNLWRRVSNFTNQKAHIEPRKNCFLVLFDKNLGHYYFPQSFVL